MNGGVRAGRCGLVWVVVTVMAAALLAWLVPASSHPARPDFAGWLTSGCALVAAVCVGWLWILVTVVVADVLRGRPGRRGGVPRYVRRLVLAACGMTLAGGLLSPVQADPVPVADPGPRPEATAALLSGLPLPDRTTTTTQWLGRLSRHAVSHEQQREPADVVVVARGDSLWAIAERTLPVRVADTEIERRWREIYRANRDLVGADPDLIRPGQRLALPHSLEGEL